MWKYVGPYLDPHRRAYVSGMVRQMTDADDLKLMDGLLDKNAEPLVATYFQLDRSGAPLHVLVYRHDGAACGFQAQEDAPYTPETMLAAARKVFPEAFKAAADLRLNLRLAPWVEPPKSAAASPEASASSTATTAPKSGKAKPSAKSSA